MTLTAVQAGMDPADLRRAFGRFGTGVTVMTTRAEGIRAGVTASSFNTVSLEPPFVLWSLSARSPSLPLFRDAGVFAVNVLSLEQLELSHHFSRPAADKFAGVPFRDGLDGLPLLDGCAATIECAVIDEHLIGDHVLFIGRVRRYADEHADPLLFFNGQYVQAAGLPAARAN